MSIDQNVPIVAGAPDYTSAIALANGAALVVGVFKGIVGKDIADSLNGSRLMQDQIAQLACTRIAKELTERHTQAKNMRLNGYN